MIDVLVISPMVAEKIAKTLSENGFPPENRVVICVNQEDQVTKSGIILPGSIEEGIAKKGVIVQVGNITEEYDGYRNILKTGAVVYYGDYAGKELGTLKAMEVVPSKSKLRVLSINEIMYLENNPHN